MQGIDWNKYEQLCEDSVAPVIGRFETTLCRAAGVATKQSIPIYTGAMKGCLVTALRQMTDILKQMAAEKASEEAGDRIRWKNTEERMREAYFERLCGIDGMQIAVEYVNTRLRNQPSDKDGIYRWVGSFQKNDRKISRIVRQVMEASMAFAREDVPGILETAFPGKR